MSIVPSVSVIIPAHNPNAERLTRTLAGLRAQTLPLAQWELLVVDNASVPMLTTESLGLAWHPQAQVVREEKLGLTPARQRGFATARHELFVLVDDDNVLAPDYLAHVAARFSADAKLGAIGGKSVPEFAAPPPWWLGEFEGLLALRDLGDEERRAVWPADPQKPREYPLCAPIGAGMALRRAAAQAYLDALERDPARRAFDRTGRQLVSGGDNDLVMTILEAGYAVAYCPELSLTHLIPAARLQRKYLGALNRAIARSWVRVLALHNIHPWRAVPPATLPLRKTRSWFRTRAWKSAAHWVRWQARCGQFEGQADLMSRS